MYAKYLYESTRAILTLFMSNGVWCAHDLDGKPFLHLFCVNSEVMVLTLLYKTAYHLLIHRGACLIIYKTQNGRVIGELNISNTRMTADTVISVFGK